VGRQRHKKNSVITINVAIPSSAPDDSTMTYAVATGTSGRRHQTHCTTVLQGGQFQSFCDGAKYQNSSVLCKRITRTANSTTTDFYPCDQPPLNTAIQQEIVSTTELFYNSSSPNILTFENNELTGWK
jgi:hypothetical protein